jgi:translation initiation factor 4E
LSIWNRSSGDQAVTTRIRDTFRRVLNLPPGTVTEYKAHNDSIKYGNMTQPTTVGRQTLDNVSI